MRRLKRSILKSQGGRGAVLLCLFGSAAAARAQQVIAPLPSINTTPPALLELRGEEPAIVPGEIQLFKWGPVTLNPHLDYQFSYGTGIQNQPGQQQNTIVQTFSPGILFGLTKHWTLDYTPSFIFYSSSQLRDTVGQSVTLSGVTSYQDWFLSFSQNFTETDSPEVETGTQTKSENLTTAFTASYAFTSKISLDMLLNQGLSLASGLQNYSTWSTMEYLNYQAWSRFTVGAGAGVTYSSVGGGPDTVSENYELRATWNPATKTSLSVNGGINDQQYLSGGQSDVVTPVFGASITYTPVSTTVFTLSGSRAISPSTFQQLTSVNTSLSLGINQTLFTHFNLSLTGSYNDTAYSASVANNQFTNPNNIQANRTDDYYAVNVRLSTAIRTHINASIFYQYSVNASSQAGFGFVSSQTGFEVGYHF